jgi:tetratricopeptide (TPR) repeat protein
MRAILPARTAALAAAGLAVGTGAAAQVPALKGEPPPATVMVCPPSSPRDAPLRPDTATVVVDRLMSGANQALILGDLTEADTLLARVLEADPRAAEAAYLRGRIAADRADASAAASFFCRYLELAPSGSSASEARRRLDEATAAGAADAVYEAFRTGVERFRAGDLERAEERFSWLLAARPGAAEAYYNRGLVRVAAGRSGPARADLERYLELRPDAADRPVVEGLMADLATVRSAPRPASAFLLGTVFPGGGQFYTRRPLLGIVVTGLAAGAVGAGLTYERTTILCRDPDPSGGCAPGAIASRETERPLLVAGLAVAGGLALVAAVEAAVHAGRGRGARSSIPVGAGESARIRVGPGPTGDSPVVRLSLIRLRF